MRARTVLGLAAAAAFVGFLAHTTAATQCPMREIGPCAKAHALIMRTRAPAPPAPIMLALAAPMRGGAPLGDGAGVARRLAAVEVRR